MLLMQLYVKIGDILTDLHDHIISLRVTLFIFHQNLSFSTKEKSLPWPALSPDLKLIKHLWDELGRRVRNGLNPPETLDELRRALIQEWNNIPQAFIRKLIGSMRRRCQAVINARGGHTLLTLSNSFLMLKLVP
jgi:hypothetical protein